MAYVQQLESNFLMMVGDFDTFYGHSSLSQNRLVAILFMMFYIVLVTILLVNLLIAMMGARPSLAPKAEKIVVFSKQVFPFQTLFTKNQIRKNLRASTQLLWPIQKGLR